MSKFKILIPTDLISSNTSIKNIAETSLLLNLIREYGTFWRNVTFQNDNILMKSIDLVTSEDIFDQYMAFTDIRSLILSKLNEPTFNPDGLTSFSTDDPGTIAERLEEYQTVCSKIDGLVKEFRQTQAGNQILFEEMQELKELYLKLNKKNWKHVVLGKLGDLALAKILDKDTLSYFYQTITNEIHHLIK